jgi:hypothetical protein
VLSMEQLAKGKRREIDTRDMAAMHGNRNYGINGLRCIYPFVHSRYDGCILLHVVLKMLGIGEAPLYLRYTSFRASFLPARSVWHAVAHFSTMTRD